MADKFRKVEIYDRLIHDTVFNRNVIIYNHTGLMFFRCSYGSCTVYIEGLPNKKIGMASTENEFVDIIFNYLKS